MPSGIYNRKPRLNLIGHKFGRLTVLSYDGKQFWLCVCECGSQRSIDGGSLRYNMTKSCGCIRDEVSTARVHNIMTRKNVLPQGEAAKRELYRRYASGARVRNLEFSISILDFTKLIVNDCHYCGRIASQVALVTEGQNRKKIYGNFIYSGIDRKDSSKGYVQENCIPCCRICNRAKSNMSYEAFLEYIKDLVTFRKNP